MDGNQIVIRVFHLLGATIALGGGIYTFIVMRRVIPLVPESDRDHVREALRKRWAGLFMLSITLLLLTGLYTYMVYKVPQHKGDGRYHGVMGAKILLAMAIFFIGSALAGRSPAFAKMRANAGFWQIVNITLGFVVIMLAGIAHAMPIK